MTISRSGTADIGGARHGRDQSLEGIRGVAAVVVVLWHNMLGFFPRQSGVFPQLDQSAGGGASGMPWFGLLNGTAAVTVFFVLSGLVLSRAYLSTGDASIIARGALKRWPRLAGPVLVVVVISALLDRFGLYGYDQAAALTGSPWLAGHLFHAIAPEARGVTRAISQGFMTFIRGDSYYDTSLWTMRYEMTGSYVVFGLVLILGQLRGSARAVVYVLCVSLLISVYLDIYTFAFIVGVCVAQIQIAVPCRIPASAGVGMAVLGVFLLGYSGLAVGSYRPLASLVGSTNPVYLHITGAVIIIFAADGTAALKRLLRSRPSSFLGRISFPLYLVHIPILCSAGCGMVRALAPSAGVEIAGSAALLTTIAVSLAASVPLALLNDIWTARVDRWARRFAGEAAAVGPAPSH